MKLIEYAIIGSGISAFIASQKNNNSIILTKTKKNPLDVERCINFYEYNNVGGNSNIWGGYINLVRLNYLFKKNKDFMNFFKMNIFMDTAKISNRFFFRYVGYLKNKKDNKILRINKNFFKKIINFKLIKIKIKKNKHIILFNKSKRIEAKTVNLCVGNLGLIRILYNSDLIKEDDIISYEDGDVRYFPNIMLNTNKYYYIPMSIKQIFEKLFYKSFFYKANENDNNLLVQAMRKKKNFFKFRVKDLLNMKESYHRGLTSNHIANLRINGTKINMHVKKISPNIKVNCSGVINSYIAGSISQDIIYNSYCGS